MGKLIFQSNLENKTYIDYKQRSLMNNVEKTQHIHNTKNIKNIKNTNYDFSSLLNTQNQKDEIDHFFDDFYNNVKNCKRGLFIYGKSGCGKTEFIKNYLKDNNYDPIFYEPYEQRNKNSLQLDNMYNTRVNVLNMFKQKQEQNKVVIVVDEIENMNNGDKTGITSLIKCLKIKKNKRTDVKNINPIICIGSTNSEKKIKELLDVCKVIVIDNPTNTIIESILKKYINFNYIQDKKQLNKLVNIVGNNLHRVNTIIDFINKNINTHLPATKSEDTLNVRNKNNIMNYFFDSSESTNEIVQKLYKTKFSIDYHKKIISDNDRTIVNLIWHENLPNILSSLKIKEKINIYKILLDNICLGDLMDRVIFQNQIWYLGEYSSLLKTFYNNFLLHKIISNKTLQISAKKQIDFTKVLTKYSTEYNNTVFITRLCEKIFCDKKDLFWIFTEIYQKQLIEDQNEANSDNELIIEENDNENEVDHNDHTITIATNVKQYHKIVNEYDISKLDINRILKLINYVLVEN